MSDLRTAAQQALEVINDTAYGAPVFRQEVRDTITALRAALAQQAEPVAWEGWWLHHGQHNYRAKPLTSERVKELMKLAFEVGREATLPQHAEPVSVAAAMRDARLNAGWGSPAQRAEPWERRVALAEQLQMQQAEPLTIERLRDALVASRIIPPAAVEDPDGYDDGVTLFRIEALHRRIT